MHQRLLATSFLLVSTTLFGCPGDDTPSGTGDLPMGDSTGSEPQTTTDEPEPEPETTTGEDTTGDGPLDDDSTTTTSPPGSTGDEPDPLRGYDDCVNEPVQPCDGICLTDAVLDPGTEPTIGVCSPTGCESDDDCAPGGSGDATPNCVDLLVSPDSSCVLSCAEGETCPTGMDCFSGVCGWPLDFAFDPCLDGNECAEGDQCIVNAAEATFSACATPECETSADCGPVPVGGDSIAVCGDITGDGITNCFLDCSTDTQCPTGMICFNDFVCLWPSEALGTGLVLFEDDFQTEDFSLGWTTVDVDGLPHNVGTQVLGEFGVGDGWWVSDWEMNPNFAATTSSWYDPPAASDDWLISPIVTIGGNAELRWDARSANNSFPESYEVHISTTAPTVDGMLANPTLMTVVDANEVEQHMVVDLAAAGYVDEAIWVGFHSIGFDGSALFIDNVQIID